MPRAVIFDVDKTLTRSKQQVRPEMAEELAALAARLPIAVISGDSLAVLEKNVVAALPATAPREHLYLLPTSGAALYEWQQEWRKVYEERIPEHELGRIDAAIHEACASTGLIDFAAPAFGERIEHRGGQVTLSALGQEAPIEAKEAWDPDRSKKAALRDSIATLLPEYDVKVGGSTSIDITLPGINKAYGVRKLAEHLHIPAAEMLYVGDELSAGGNDEVVKETGIATHQVASPEKTAELIKQLLSQ